MFCISKEIVKHSEQRALQAQLWEPVQINISSCTWGVPCWHQHLKDLYHKVHWTDIALLEMNWCAVVAIVWPDVFLPSLRQHSAIGSVINNHCDNRYDQCYHRGKGKKVAGALYPRFTRWVPCAEHTDTHCETQRFTVALSSLVGPSGIGDISTLSGEANISTIDHTNQT